MCSGGRQEKGLIYIQDFTFDEQIAESRSSSNLLIRAVLSACCRDLHLLVSACRVCTSCDYRHTPVYTPQMITRSISKTPPLRVTSIQLN